LAGQGNTGGNNPTDQEGKDRGGNSDELTERQENRTWQKTGNATDTMKTQTDWVRESINAADGFSGNDKHNRQILYLAEQLVLLSRRLDECEDDAEHLADKCAELREAKGGWIVDEYDTDND
jgi:hypothetical protein